MAEASNNSEWFSCGLQLPPRSLSLLIFHARVCSSLSFSYINTSTANANSQRLVCCTFKADTIVGLVAEVPHVMEIIMALDVVVDHSSQFVSTAKKQSWPRNLNQPFSSFLPFPLERKSLYGFIIFFPETISTLNTSKYYQNI